MGVNVIPSNALFKVMHQSIVSPILR